MSELASLIGERVRAALPDRLRVHGEVSDSRIDKGWAHFDLVERSDNQRRPRSLHVFLAVDDRIRLQQELLSHDVELNDLLLDGQAIVVGGRLAYSDWDQLELRMDSVDPVATRGLLVEAKTSARAELHRLDLYDHQRHLPLPLAPTRVAIVSRSGTEGLADVTSRLAQANFAIDYRLFSAKLEGVGAIEQLTRAITNAGSADHDLILVVRGGGNDIGRAPFDAFAVAEAVARASVPVITGIGHTRDQTLADEVAHNACDTPTGAAEFIVRQLEEAARRLWRQRHATNEAATAALDRIRADYEATIVKLEDAIQDANARLATRRRRLAVTVGLTLPALVLLLATVTHGTARVIAALGIAAGILAMLLGRRAIRNHKEPPMILPSRWQSPSYAEALHRLETIQQQLAETDSPESVTTLITEATELRRHCQDILGRSEQMTASQR